MPFAVFPKREDSEATLFSRKRRGTYVGGFKLYLSSLRSMSFGMLFANFLNVRNIHVQLTNYEIKKRN